MCIDIRYIHLCILYMDMNMHYKVIINIYIYIYIYILYIKMYTNIAVDQIAK